MKLRALAVLAALATVSAETDSAAMGLTVIDFDALQRGECTASARADSTSTSTDDYAANYDEYYKDASSSPDALSTALCKCLDDSGVQSAVGPSAYAAALQSFMDCVAKADAAAAKRIAKYEKSLLPDTNASTTAAATNETSQDVTAAAAAAAAETAETTSSSSSSEDSISVTNSSDSAEWPFSDLSSTEAEVGSAAVLMGVDPTDDRFGHAAMYIMFIGVSVLLFVCAWFVKGSLHGKFGKGGYDAVSYSSEADADDRGDPYNHAAGGADWEDMYDHSAASFKQEKQQKGKFGDWAQYNAV